MTAFVSDVHGAFAPLRKVLDEGDSVIVLGDLANLSDYRTGEGALADVLGMDFARDAGRARAAGDYERMRALWSEHVGNRVDEVRRAIGEAIADQYREAAEVLSRGEGWVIHGNVDHPEMLAASLPESFTYAHGEVIEVQGARVGLVGGGVPTPVKARGEATDEEMAALLTDLGPVDILCTHVPPAIHSLRHDVITGRSERGSGPVLEYVREHQPSYHLYGDVHQPKATAWRIGRTTCMNAGYFRATGRFLRLADGVVRPTRIR